MGVSGEGAFVAAFALDPREQRHGNLADRFLDYFDLRLFYIYAATTPLNSTAGYPRLDTLSAADNLSAFRAKNANNAPFLAEEIKE